jgi:hypothetical protein
VASNFGTKPLVTMMVDDILYAVEARDQPSAGGYTEEAMKAREAREVDGRARAAPTRMRRRRHVGSRYPRQM